MKKAKRNSTKKKDFELNLTKKDYEEIDRRLMKRRLKRMRNGMDDFDILEKEWEKRLSPSYWGAE